MRFDLPDLHTEDELASWLGLPLSRLSWFTHDGPLDGVWHYRQFTIPKRNGDQRIILAPKHELKCLQRKVLHGMLDRVPVASVAHGFTTGRSIVTNATPHVGKHIVVNIDLQDFFPSITLRRVRALFLSFGYPFPVASKLALLCTEYTREVAETSGDFKAVGIRRLMPGAPTSPAISNIIAWRLDKRLQGLASKNGFTYTRYADDLTFSGDDPTIARWLPIIVQRIVEEEKFTVNQSKTHCRGRSRPQVVTGLVVNDKVATPRKLRKWLRAVITNASITGLATQNLEHHPNFRAYLLGLIAFVHAANPEHAAVLRVKLDACKD